jgi:rod shape-determining protein MreB
MGLLTGNYLAIDLGSSNTSVYLGGEGVVLREPTAVLALRADPEAVIAIGHEAKAMLGRSSGEAVMVSPVMDGAVTDVDMAALITLAFCEKVTGRRKSLDKIQLMMACPRADQGGKGRPDAGRQAHRRQEPAARARAAGGGAGSGLSVDRPGGRWS